MIINKSNLIDASYFDNLELVECDDVLGETISVEKETYAAYLKLKKFLKTKNIFVELDSAYRSVEEQQRIIDDYTIKYGIDYVKKLVFDCDFCKEETSKLYGELMEVIR